MPKPKWKSVRRREQRRRQRPSLSFVDENNGREDDRSGIATPSMRLPNPPKRRRRRTHRSRELINIVHDGTRIENDGGNNERFSHPKKSHTDFISRTYPCIFYM